MGVKGLACAIKVKMYIYFPFPHCKAATALLSEKSCSCWKPCCRKRKKKWEKFSFTCETGENSAALPSILPACEQKVTGIDWHC